MSDNPHQFTHNAWEASANVWDARIGDEGVRSRLPVALGQNAFESVFVDRLALEQLFVTNSTHCYLLVALQSCDLRVSNAPQALLHRLYYEINMTECREK